MLPESLPGRWGEAQSLGAWLCVFSLGALGCLLHQLCLHLPLYPAWRDSAGPGGWLSPGSSTLRCRRAQAVGEDGTCRRGLPATWDAAVLGMKHEGWGSTAQGESGQVGDLPS